MSRGTSKTPQSQSAPFLSPESRGILLKGNSHDVALKKKKYAVGDVVARGKHGQVALGEGEVTPTTFSFAVKAQVIHHPPNFADRPYREYVIFKHLSKLRLQSEFYPNSHYSGFVRLLDWFTDATEQSSNHRTLNLVLEKAETTLGKVKKLSSYDYKCIIFQILFALNVAQSKYEFVHNDLHLQNVLLKKPTSRTGPVGVFKDEDTQWYTAGQWIAKLSDFGLSRMKTEDDHIIFDTTRPIAELFLPQNDIDQLSRALSAIQMEDILSVKEIDVKAASGDSSTLEQKLSNLVLMSETGYIKISDTSELEVRTALEAILETSRTQLSDLRAKMKKSSNLSRLLRHPFFTDLQKRPPEADLEQPSKKKLSLTKRPSRRIGNEDKENAVNQQVNIMKPPKEPHRKRLQLLLSPSPVSTPTRPESTKAIADVQSPMSGSLPITSPLSVKLREASDPPAILPPALTPPNIKVEEIKNEIELVEEPKQKKLTRTKSNKLLAPKTANGKATKTKSKKTPSPIEEKKKKLVEETIDTKLVLEYDVSDSSTVADSESEEEEDEAPHNEEKSFEPIAHRRPMRQKRLEFELKSKSSATSTTATKKKSSTKTAAVPPVATKSARPKRAKK